MERYRTFGPRFWAGFIDGLILLPIGLADNYLLSPERGPILLILWASISYSAYWLYSVIFHARYGQTFGKMLTHVKVLNLAEDRTPTISQVFLRDIGYIIINALSLAYFIHLVITNQYTSDLNYNQLPGRILAYAGLGWFLLEIVTMLTNVKNRALHDYIAGTVVIRTD